MTSLSLRPDRSLIKEEPKAIIRYKVYNVFLILSPMLYTMIWYLNSISDWNLSCARAFLSQSYMATKYIN